MMAALLRYTSLRPYWNVPPDLAAERIAPNVVKHGPAYLRQKGYQLLSDWSDKARVISPAGVDWAAVAAGRKEVRLRQLPGPANSMGDMKFMFPNAQGIYLHDTPQDELFGEAARLFSGGCVRLEAAHRLGAWLYGKPLKARGKGGRRAAKGGGKAASTPSAGKQAGRKTAPKRSGKASSRAAPSQAD